MYKSTIHTPASRCSAGTGISGGPARSVLEQMDDFDKQLKEKLEASFDITGNLASKDAAERAAEKVAEWRRNMDSLLDDDVQMIEEEGSIFGSETRDDVDGEIGVCDDTKTNYRRNSESIKSTDELKELVGKEPLDGKEKSNNQGQEQWRMILE